MLIKIVIVITAVLGAVILKYLTKDIFNPCSVFLLYWGFVCFMASLRLYQIKEASQRAYLYVFIGMISFFFGSLVFSKLSFSFSLKKREHEINYSFFVLACLIVIAYSVYRGWIILKLLQKGYSWWSIRLMNSNSSDDNLLIGGNYSQVIYSFIVSPLLYLIVPTIFADFIIGNRKPLVMILGLLSMIVYSVSTVSRSLWGFSLIYLVFIIIYCRKNIVFSKKIKKAMKFIPLFVAVFVVAIFLLTKLRNSNSDILTNAYCYISGSMPLFSIYLEQPFAEKRTYGNLTLFGYMYPVYFVLNRLHILPYPDIYYLARDIKDNLETFHRLSPTITMNAYSTLYYDFYVDFGVPGIIGGSAVFGAICMSVYNKFIKNNDILSLVVLLILVQFILFSVARIYTILPTRALSFLFVVFMFRRKDGSNRIKFSLK